MINDFELLHHIASLCKRVKSRKNASARWRFFGNGIYFQRQMQWKIDNDILISCCSDNSMPGAFVSKNIYWWIVFICNSVTENLSLLKICQIRPQTVFFTPKPTNKKAQFCRQTWIIIVTYIWFVVVNNKNQQDKSVHTQIFQNCNICILMVFGIAFTATYSCDKHVKKISMYKNHVSWARKPF